MPNSEQDPLKERVDSLEERVVDLERGSLAQHALDKKRLEEEGAWSDEDDRKALIQAAFVVLAVILLCAGFWVLLIAA